MCITQKRLANVNDANNCKSFCSLNVVFNVCIETVAWCLHWNGFMMFVLRLKHAVNIKTVVDNNNVIKVGDDDIFSILSGVCINRPLMRWKHGFHFIFSRNWRFFDPVTRKRGKRIWWKARKCLEQPCSTKVLLLTQLV